MNHKLDALAKGLAQSITRWRALRRSIFGLAGTAMASLLVLSVVGQSIVPGAAVELSVPNAIGSCDEGFRLPGNMTLDDAVEPFVAVNPANAKNIVAAWIQGPIQNNVAAASFDGGTTWQQ